MYGIMTNTSSGSSMSESKSNYMTLSPGIGAIRPMSSCSVTSGRGRTIETVTDGRVGDGVG